MTMNQMEVEFFIHLLSLCQMSACFCLGYLYVLVIITC